MENATLSTTGLNSLYQASRWARFIAIIGFVFIGIIILAGIIVGPILSALNEDVSSGALIYSKYLFSGIYIVMGILYFFPVYFLFQFSNGFIVAFKNASEEGINLAVDYLRKHFQFIGILLIVTLSLYVIAFAVGMLFTVLK
ncbi:MAG: hypothetical protein JW729_09070 [Bacteroidales bacterium]|nr:hypothetical protein [Bacteroidales bacterium]